MLGTGVESLFPIEQNVCSKVKGRKRTRHESSIRQGQHTPTGVGSKHQAYRSFIYGKPGSAGHFDVTAMCLARRVQISMSLGQLHDHHPALESTDLMGSRVHISHTNIATEGLDMAPRNWIWPGPGVLVEPRHCQVWPVKTHDAPPLTGAFCGFVLLLKTSARVMC